MITSLREEKDHNIKVARVSKSFAFKAHIKYYRYIRYPDVPKKSPENVLNMQSQNGQQEEKCITMVQSFGHEIWSPCNVANVVSQGDSMHIY